MGILDGQLAKQIYAGFKGRLLRGRLRRIVSPSGLDANGDPVGGKTEIKKLEGFTDNYSDFSRANGIPETDLKVCIFTSSLPPGYRPLKDDKVGMTQAGVERWFQLRRDATDPAEALWTCQAFEIPAPVPIEIP